MHRSKKAYVAVFALISIVFLAGSVLGQETGGLKGKIRNYRGDGIPAVTVTIRKDSQDVRSTTSNSKGDFSIAGLSAGTYNVVFDAKGYGSGLKYGVEVKANKTTDLGDRLIMQVDRGSQVIVQGSVFFKDGTSVTGAKIEVERLLPGGGTQKIGSLSTDVAGEFAFRRPEGSAKFRITAKYKDSSASKEIEVDSAAIYRLAISLDVNRQEK